MLNIKNNHYITPPLSIELTDAFIQFANPCPTIPIVLIKPPIVFSKNSYSTPIALPLGLAYIASVLEKSGYITQIIDCPGLDINNIQLTSDGNFHILGLNAIDSIKLIHSTTDIIGITIMFSQEWPFIKNYIHEIRKSFPNVKIVIGGEHATAMPEFCLQDCTAIDYVITGEGEMPFLELIFKLRSQQSINTIRGLVFRQDTQILRGGLLPRMTNIKDIPWPAWHLINLEPYFQPNYTMGISHGRNIAMLATRGCPYQCTFCSNPQMWTTRYTMRDVSNVVDEIEEYIQRYKVTSIDFYDLTAIVKKEWTLELIKELKQRNIKIVWQLPSGTRSESLDEEVLSGLKETGCKFVVYAPESGSQRTLNMIKKRVNLNNLQKSISIALKKGLIVKINFIIGFPFEQRKDIFQTLLFSWKLALLKTQDCNISPFSPYPGSELFKQMVDDGQLGKINDDYFKGLITQFDLTIPRSFCRSVGNVELMSYRILGMLVFYLLTYLRCPGRILNTFTLLFTNKSLETNSLFEQRILDLKHRLLHRNPNIHKLK